MGNFINYDKSYGLQNTLQGSQSAGIIAQRDPLTSDAANPGQYWLNQITHTGFICNGAIAGAFQWSQLAYAPGDTFPQLTVNPGPTNITGLTNINAGAGNADVNINTAGTGNVSLGNAASALTTILGASTRVGSTTQLLLSATTDTFVVGINSLNLNFNINAPTNINTGTSAGSVTVGNLANAGVVQLFSSVSIGLRSTGLIPIRSDSVSGTAINLLAPNGGVGVSTGAGGFTLASTGTISETTSGLVQIGSTNVSNQAVYLSAGAGGIFLEAAQAAGNAIELDATDAAGGVRVVAGTGGFQVNTGGYASMQYIATAPGAFVTAIASNAGRAVFLLSGAPLAPGATQVLTIQNAAITTSSMILNTLQIQLVTDQIAIVGYHCTAGVSFEVYIQNVGAGATTGNVALNFWILGY